MPAKRGDSLAMRAVRLYREEAGYRFVLENMQSSLWHNNLFRPERTYEPETIAQLSERREYVWEAYQALKRNSVLG